MANAPSQSRNGEVGALLSESIQLCLPPKAEPSGDRDSRYSSIASTPVSNSHEPLITVPVRSTPPVEVKASPKGQLNRPIKYTLMHHHSQQME